MDAGRRQELLNQQKSLECGTVFKLMEVQIETDFGSPFGYRIS
jgi:hypothetical protein